MMSAINVPTSARCASTSRPSNDDPGDRLADAREPTLQHYVAAFRHRVRRLRRGSEIKEIAV